MEFARDNQAGGSRHHRLLLLQPLLDRDRHAGGAEVCQRLQGEVRHGARRCRRAYYDAFGLLTQAIKEAGKMDRQAIRDALAKIQKYEGVTGTMQFAGTGDPIKSAVILQIKDGQFAWVANAQP